MPGLTKVLFQTDFSELANHALPYAIRMAKLFDAELVMLHAVTLYEHDPNDPEHRFPSLDAYCEEVRRMAGEDLQMCIERIGEHGVSVREEIVQGVSPHAAILEFLRDEGDVGLVVMSTHGRSGLRHVLLGSVTENVIRYAPAPVLVVKRPEHEFIDPETGDVHIRKILFPVDFSEESYKPVPWVKAVAEMTGAEVIVFHAVDVEIPPVYYSSGITSILELDPGLNERVEKKMRDALEAKLGEIDTRYVVREGRAIDRIRELAADEQVDLVVMGQAGAHGIGDFLLGSTSARVVQRAVCPVLVV